MDHERFVEEPNQVLHPGKYRRERYNDTNGAVYETTHYDAHGNAFTQNHQLGPAERYGYNYVGGDAPRVPRAHAQPWVQPAAGAAAAAAGAVGGAAAYYEIADNHVQGNMSSEDGEDSGEFVLFVLVTVAVLALGPLFLGAWMVRRAAAAGRSLTHGRFVLLMEVPWLALLWGWLFDGGVAAWIAAVGTAGAVGVWYGLTLRDEARRRRGDAEPA
ncbi:hypothetical protein AAW14_24030 [Streptomyces hygroscopicus]|uniref:hypothetical protein n=1 Tax=Streptomyces hygroscopicus TaxID=1912 RepID=UPI00223F28ED|nr:hypothetical protein [Streptomyces hygroscopicus]MCW7944999.1 hypothetical protein [Streptomyces hygroscopicus]